MKIHCLIIDDEPSSQTVLKHFINDVNFLTLEGVCNSALEALEFLSSNTTIDLIFLDINMPKLSGLSFYKSLQNPPKVIFTTAYSEYALEGFELDAVDYLLKPFAFERFLTAVQKAKNLLHTSSISAPNYVIIKSNKVLHKVNLEDILYIEAFGDYVKVHLENDFILTNSTFTKMLNEFQNRNFVRVHKSFAINLNYLQKVKGNLVTVKNKELPIGQAYKLDFLDKLKS